MLKAQTSVKDQEHRTRRMGWEAERGAFQPWGLLKTHKQQSCQLYFERTILVYAEISLGGAG